MQWVRDQVRKCPALHHALVALVMYFWRQRETLNRMTNSQKLKTITDFPLFAPASAGSYAQRASLTKEAINQIFPFLVDMIEFPGRQSPPMPLPIEEFVVASTEKTAIAELKQLFDHYGSDKSTAHNYHLLYGSILSDRTAAVKLAEIGLGSNDPAIVSNMGAKSAPGASLRAFAEFVPHGSIYGADIDEKILFETDRIKTYFVDQTKPASLKQLSDQLPGNFDLIIDDGLHSPHANIASLTALLPKLKQGGWYVIEDIAEAALPLWQVVSSLLSAGHQSWILRSAQGYLLFVVRRLGPEGPHHTDRSIQNDSLLPPSSVR
ncbi:MAG TPA: class I SAM-dependent methyltransferase [Stellaceae bacterium]|jgi:hypothetical protein